MRSQVIFNENGSSHILKGREKSVIRDILELILRERGIYMLVHGLDKHVCGPVIPLHPQGL